MDAVQLWYDGIPSKKIRLIDLYLFGRQFLVPLLFGEPKAKDTVVVFGLDISIPYVIGQLQ